MKKIIVLMSLLFLFFPYHVKAISAECVIVMDQDSGRVLYEHNSDRIRSVASISKIMTGILAIESGKLNEVVTVDEVIKDAYGSGIYIKVGEQIKLKDLVYGLMLRSGNDAALMIAKYVAGSVSDFVSLMNQKAAEIGMNKTTFNNPSGLDEEDAGNLSTAYDMAILTSYAMKNDIYREITSTKKHTVKTNMNTYSWTNKNKMLSIYPYVTGGKTGYTDNAKRTLVSTATKDDTNLVIVTLNDGNDFLDHKALYMQYFNIYKTYDILVPGNIDILNETYYRNYDIYIKDEFKYILDDKEKDNILLKFEIKKLKNYKDGDTIGKVHVFLEKEELFTTDLYIKNPNPTKPGLLKIIIDWFKNLW